MTSKVIGRIWVMGRYDLMITSEIWNNKKLRKALIKNIDIAVNEVDVNSEKVTTND